MSSGYSSLVGLGVQVVAFRSRTAVPGNMKPRRSPSTLEVRPKGTGSAIVNSERSELWKSGRGPSFPHGHPDLDSTTYLKLFDIGMTSRRPLISSLCLPVRGHGRLRLLWLAASLSLPAPGSIFTRSSHFYYVICPTQDLCTISPRGVSCSSSPF